jgi:hypothetical protein
LIFLESRQNQDRVFVGGATPAMVHQALAAENPKLREAYREAYQAVNANGETVLENRVYWIAYNYLYHFDKQGGEEQVRKIVTRQFLDRCLPMTGNSIEWDGGSPTTCLLYHIIDRTEPYVSLVRSNGQLNLVIDRLKLAEYVAKTSLRHLLD